MKDFYFSNEDEEKDFLKNQRWLIHSLIIEGVKKSMDENLDEIVSRLLEVGKMESPPKMEGRMLVTFLVPDKNKIKAYKSKMQKQEDIET